MSASASASRISARDSSAAWQPTSGFAPAQPARKLVADVDRLIGIRHEQSLAVGIDGDELDALHARFNHAVHGIGTAAAYADDLDDRKIIVAKNLLHYVLAFDFISALPHKDRKPQETLGLFYTMAC